MGDLDDILENSPLPILIHQEGRIVYCNKATVAFLRAAGYLLESASLGEADVFAFLAYDEAVAGQRSQARLLESGQPVFNISRTFIDRHGNRIRSLGSAVQVEWQGRPALEVSFLVLSVGEGPEGVWDPLRAKNLSVRNDMRTTVLEALTPRQRDVALYLAEGYSTAATAAILGVTEETVRSHLKQVYKRTGTGSRVELVNLLLGNHDRSGRSKQ